MSSLFFPCPTGKVKNLKISQQILQYPVYSELGNLQLEQTKFTVFSLCFGQMSRENTGNSFGPFSLFSLCSGDPVSLLYPLFQVQVEFTASGDTASVIQNVRKCSNFACPADNSLTCIETDSGSTKCSSCCSTPLCNNYNLPAQGASAQSVTMLGLLSSLILALFFAK